MQTDLAARLEELAGTQTWNREFAKLAWEHKADIIAALRAGEWQPIETAPCAELDLILLWSGKEVTGGARWESGWADWLHDWIDPQPTHWRALPTPPAKETPTND